jgi:hypothetical protein
MKYILIFALLLPSLTTAQGNKNKMTSLDSAYMAAQESEEHHSSFYNTFLNSELFIPTHDKPEQDQDRRTSENESISPIFVESEGVPYLMLFDSKEKLSAWAQKEVGFVALSGHTVVEMMSAEIHWTLNVGTEYVKIFVPEEIQWLKQNLAESKGQEIKMAVGTNITIGTPASVSNGLIELLLNKIKRNSEIKKAYLGQVHFDKEGEIPHLALVLNISDIPQSTIEAITKDLVIATKGFLGESEYIDIMVNNGSGVAHEVTKSVKPFYESSN